MFLADRFIGRGYCYRLDVCLSVCLSVRVTTVDCDQTAGWIELILGTDLPLPKRHHVLGGGPPPLFWGKLGAPNFWVQWEGIGKFQAIVMKFLVQRLSLAQETCLPNFSPIAPKIGELRPQSLGFNVKV